MASTFSKLRDELGDDLESQVAMLQREVKSLRKSLGKRGSAAYADSRETAAEFYDDVVARISEAVPHITRQSRVVGKVAADNPVATAVVGLAVLGLVAGLMLRR